MYSRNVKGKNGITCFFSEETYSRFLGKETFESRLQQNLKKVGINIPPLLHFEPKEPVASTTNTGADIKDENETEGIAQSVEVPSISPKKRKNKKQSKRKLKGELASQNDLKPELNEKSVDLDESKLIEESANHDEANLEDGSESQSSADLDVSDMVKRAREYALSKTEKKNVCDTETIIREKREDNSVQESQSSHVKEDVEKNPTKLNQHDEKPDDINESVSEMKDSVEPANKNLNIATLADKIELATKAHTNAPVKEIETDATLVIPETESNVAAHTKHLEKLKDENQKEKVPTITKDSKTLSKPTEKMKEKTTHVIIQEKARTIDEKVKSMKHAEGLKGDDIANREASELSSDEDGDSARGYGKQRKLEQEKNFQERKRNEPQRRGRRMK